MAETYGPFARDLRAVDLSQYEITFPRYVPITEAPKPEPMPVIERWPNGSRLVLTPLEQLPANQWLTVDRCAAIWRVGYSKAREALHAGVLEKQIEALPGRGRQRWYRRGKG